MYTLPMQVTVDVSRAEFMQAGLLRGLVKCTTSDGRTFEVQLQRAPKQGYFSSELIAQSCKLVDSSVAQEIPDQPRGYTLTVDFNVVQGTSNATLS